MKNRRLLSCLAAAALAFPAAAQSDGDTRNLKLSSAADSNGMEYMSETAFDTGARLSGAVQYTLIPKRVHLSLEEELRFNDAFSSLHKAYTSLGMDYRIASWLKAGASYSFIAVNSSDYGWRSRHRGALSLTAAQKLGVIKLSLREKVQATYKAYDVNLYQDPRTDLSLKSRLKVAVDLPRNKWEPYAAVEMRNTLNAVSPGSFVYGTYTWEKYDGDEEEWVSKSRTCYGNLTPSYSKIYINRLRFQAGTEWKFRKKQVLDLYAVLDWNMGLDVDFSSRGIQKSYDNYCETHPAASISESYYYTYGTGILTMSDRIFAGLGLAYTFKL